MKKLRLRALVRLISNLQDEVEYLSLYMRGDVFALTVTREREDPTQESSPIKWQVLFARDGALIWSWKGDKFKDLLKAARKAANVLDTNEEPDE